MYLNSSRENRVGFSLRDLADVFNLISLEHFEETEKYFNNYVFIRILFCFSLMALVCVT